VTSQQTELAPSREDHGRPGQVFRQSIRRVTWLIALTSLTARLIVYPLDGITWHLLRENFYLSRTYRHALDVSLLLSLSAAIVLSVDALFEKRRGRRRQLSP